MSGRAEQVTLSVVIPCHDEAKILEESGRRLRAFLEESSWSCGLEPSWEVVLVNDGSADGTGTVIHNLSGRDARFRGVSYPRAGGQGKALQAGFAAARGDWVICLDADLDYGPELIQPFLSAALERQADIVIGSPYCDGGRVEGVPMVRLAMSRAMNAYFRVVFNIGVSTFTGILRLYRRAALEKLLLASFDKDLLPEILLKAEMLKMCLVEIPVVLSWDATRTAQRGKGLNIVPTARKAFRHLSIGFFERPFFFLKYPLTFFALLTLWMGAAVSIMFWRDFHGSAPSLVAEITRALHLAYATSPHTFLFFLGVAQTTLILLFSSLVVMQNKWKQDNDFVALTQMYGMLKQQAGGMGTIEGGGMETK